MREKLERACGGRGGQMDTGAEEVQKRERPVAAAK